MIALVVTLLGALLVGALADRRLLGGPARGARDGGPARGVRAGGAARGGLDDPARGAVERLGRALMLGLGVLGALSMAADAIGAGVTRTSLLALLGVFGVLVVAAPAVARRAARAPGATARGREGGVAAAAPAAAAPAAAPSAVTATADAMTAPPASVVSPWIPLARWGLLGFAALSLGLVVWLGWVSPTFQFDALTRWMFKAKVLALEGTLLGDVSTDPHFAFTHQRYPPLVSHVANLPALVSGRFDDRIASAVFPWYAVALVAVVYGAVARRRGALAGAIGAAWVASLPLLAFLPAPPPGAGAWVAMADLPLALFATGAVLAAGEALDGRRGGALGEAALLAGLATLTKNEGLPLAAALVLGTVALSGRARWRRGATLAACIAVLHALLWGLLAARFPALDEHYAGRMGVGAISQGLHRLPGVLARFGAELVAFTRWNATWPAVAALLLIGAGAVRRSRGLLLGLLVVGVQLAAYVWAYVVTSWSSPAAVAATQDGDPVAYLMDLTLGRLLLHVAPLSIALALMAAPAPDAAEDAGGA